MGIFIAYVLQVAFVSALLYAAYILLLGRTTFHKFNRTVTLCIMAAAYILPVGISMFHITPTDVVSETMVLPLSIGTEVVGNTDAAQDSGVNWGSVLSIIYLIGLITALVISSLGIYRIVNIIRKGDKSNLDNYILVITRKAIGPFSWGRYIVVRPEDCDDDLEMILEHEKSHLAHYHWIDLMFAQLSNIVQWFNPVAYLLTGELKNIHEYQVDECVSKHRSSSYQMMLLRKTAGKLCPAFTNGFNHTQIKSRILMMVRKRSNPTRKFAVILFPVVAYFSLVSMAHPAVSSIIDKIKISDSAININAIDINKKPNMIAVTNTSDKPIKEDRKESVISYEEETQSVKIKQTDHPQVKQKPNLESFKVIGVKSEKKDTSVRYRYDDNHIALSDANKKEPAYFVDGELFTGNLNDIDVLTIESISVYKNDEKYPNGMVFITLKKSGSLSPESRSEQQKNGEDFKTSD